MEYDVVIGLEVHAQLLTESKIFCGCSTRFGAEPNRHTCPVCLGMPGVLPVMNKKVLEYAIKMALATNCHILPFSHFARKNYFYPDLPKGYQISQYENPIAINGCVEIELEGRKKRVGITRIHMEEDAGKLVHDEYCPVSLVDFNRTGIPLIEIVSEPDLRTSEEATEYLRKIRSMLRYLEICDGNMEEGSFRCDANISLCPVGSENYGVKTELKNMNSFRNVSRALEFEIKRQKDILDEGGEVRQETRLWDADQEATLPMRSKEEAHDYRYFPDPDLLPLVIEKEWIKKIENNLPELSTEKKKRFINFYQIPEYDAEVLTASKALADYFEKCVKLYPSAKIVSNWIMGDFLRELKRDNIEIEECPLSPENFVEMLKMIGEGVISSKIAKTVFVEMYRTGNNPRGIVEEKGLVQISNEDELMKIIDNVLAENPEEVMSYKEGKSKLLGFFVGEVMKVTRGKANPKSVNKLLKNRL